ncbi:carbohydrate porin [Xylophilus sp. GOD-11R]|uniref:carbohydrate porin n=1 Tax=Xylophilus sp. GOD-11R TaxID=3089814 RepID=UPI00298C35C2|nr:carbohydrate porin [Xylophilus sp. GOD-11R]WPB55014.1 carbohydrate porin [Xylophilus sp. GOD-11R]
MPCSNAFRSSVRPPFAKSVLPCVLASMFLAFSAHAAPSDDPIEAAEEIEDFSVHGQATYIAQRKPSFSAAYSGPNSLSAERERSYSFTSTAFLGVRLAPQTELYFNPEAVQGLPLSRLTGLGGLTNGELQKTAGTSILAYRARLFLRQTWGLGGGSDFVEGDANQLASRYDKRRVTLTAGNFALSDIFDNSAYAHDARTQFLNWSFLTHGAYDFAADSRGYTWGVVLEYRHDDDWTVRAGRGIQPRESNGLKLDHQFFRHYGDQVELERRWQAQGRPGALRLLAFRNVAVMGGFQDALDYASANGTTPAVAPVRERRVKTGAGINLEQEVADGIGVFGRLARNDGKSETYAFAEIDRSMSVGAVVQGGRWGRAKDTFGIAVAQNGLSPEHRDYLAAGGSGFFVGDGRLRYKPETIGEVFYRIALPNLKKLENALTLGFQHIRNPAYNADRGPVRVVSLRLHTEF